MSGDATTATAGPTGATGGHRPLRVLIAADTFAPDVNGAATFAEQLAVGLAERGHEVHVVAPASSRQHGTFDEEHHGVTLVVHRLNSYKWPLHAVAALRVAVERPASGPARSSTRSSPTCVHIQSHIVIGRGIVHEANDRGIRVIATNHFMPENLLEYTPFGKWTLPLALKIAWSDAAKTYRLADAITTPTNLAADYLRKAIAGQQVLAISCGIDASRYVAREGRPVNNDIVFVGRVAPEKNLDVLVRALALLPAELSATLTIVGDGEMIPKLTALAKELGLEDRVRFLGFVSDERKQAGPDQRDGVRDAVHGGTAEHLVARGDGLGTARRRRRLDGAAAPDRRQRLPVHPRRRATTWRRSSRRCSPRPRRSTWRCGNAAWP